MPLRNLFYLTAFVALVIWCMVNGRTVILPIVIAIMLSYVLVGATKAMRRWSLLKHCPFWLVYLLVVLIFGAALTMIGLIAVTNLRNIALSGVDYQGNILRLMASVGDALGLVDQPSWETMRMMVQDRLDLATLSLNLFGTVVSAGGYIVLVGTYVVFMVAERETLSNKIDLVLVDGGERDTAREIFDQINEQVVTYLFTKTLINAVLAVLSYGAMWLLGIENAVFWAFLIGLFNYIPYVGSLMGVAVVVGYDMLLTGDWAEVISTLVLLTIAQVYVGNWLEPRVMSRSFNMSPVVVLCTLLIWTSIWGLIGAIIAVPMTAILLIVLSAFDATRPVAILASRDGRLLD
ncbi:AI-2E family transporter [Pseudoruegeria sp. SK021]|uniref:AI-2E family transporter n=1 Tax=Pseudoruegeria sp. SK021 TaxID=1933035 RepID=UPI000A243D3C|nr:AI-2E family transporter [Pseudoruegeria sp. SK021]OSP56598.1 hypothetical protein BV911_01165 [Pseudoruegeria sp. SK021]